MTTIVGTPYFGFPAARVQRMLVPIGVTAAMTGLFVYSTASSERVTVDGVRLDGAAVSLHRVDARACNNSYVGVFAATGLAAGQTLELTFSAKAQIFLHSFYQDEYTFAAVPPGIGRRTHYTSQTTTGEVTAATGAPVIVVAAERSLDQGTEVKTVVSSGGEPVTEIGFAEDPEAPDGSVYFGRFDATTSAAYRATVDYTTTSANGYAALLVGQLVGTGPGRAVTVSVSDELVRGRVYLATSGGAVRTPAEVRSMPHGYGSVDEMLAAKPFAIGHRGSSRTWPDMSLYGYTRAAYWGVGALEVSLARTSDGVWFGLHDSTLDRTSGITGFVAAEHTWAEVQRHRISAPATGDPRQRAQPYMRWEELVAAYYGSHVLFVDPKSSGPYAAELLDRFDKLPGKPTTRIVAKSEGTSSLWGDAAHARGYTTWGIFYANDVPTLGRHQHRWDVLGMTWDAGAPAWTAVTGFGKPVIAHVVPDGAAFRTAVDHGASGVMVSGVEAALTRSG